MLKTTAMKDGYVSSAMTFYAVLYAEVRRTAFEKGYALALHGSLQKDLDVIAIPWVESASSEDDLVKAICETAGGFISPQDGKCPGLKPHGRHAWTIHLGGCSATEPPEKRATYIDLSVMPKTL